MSHDALSEPYVREGFPGQRMVVLPDSIVRDRAGGMGLLPTDVGYFPLARRHRVRRPHGMDQLIVIHCTDGAGWATIENRRYSVKAGQTLLIGRGQAHEYGSDEAYPWTIHWMHLAGAAAPELQNLLIPRGHLPLIDIGRDMELAHQFQKMIDLLCDVAMPGGVLRAALVAGGIVDRLLEAARRGLDSQSTSQRMSAVIQFMFRRISGQIRIHDLAKVAQLSPSHCVAMFKLHTGRSPIGYFHQLQMEQATHLLEHTALPIKSVANRVGYDDPLYFSRRFRKFHHLSPAQYRAKHNQRLIAEVRQVESLTSAHDTLEPETSA